MGDKHQRVFIVGVGRSGTTLLQSMLNAHPAICFAPETSFIRRFLATGSLDRLFRSDGAEAVAASLERDPLVRRLGVQAAKMRDLVLAQGAGFAAAALYCDLLEAYCTRRNAVAFIGDKDPRSVEILPVMKQLFPDAFVVHMLRDARDVLASKKKAKWSRHRSSLAHLFAHRVQARTGRECGPRLFGARYLEVRYEELIQNPAGVLERICGTLGLAFDARMLDFARSSQELVAEDELEWKRETLGPLLPGNRNKWIAELTPWEIALAGAICRETIHEGEVQAAPALRLGAKVVAGFIALADPVYRWYRSWRQG